MQNASVQMSFLKGFLGKEVRKSMHVYVDESGDLGFSGSATKFFVVAHLELSQPFTVGKCVRRLLKDLHIKHEYAAKCNELKFSKSTSKVRARVLEQVCERDFGVGFIILKKEKVKPQLRENHTVLYNFVVVDTIMRCIIPRLMPGESLTLVIDKSLSSLAREGFNSYARNKA
jgi:hypothetical protein